MWSGVSCVARQQHIHQMLKVKTKYFVLFSSVQLHHNWPTMYVFNALMLQTSPGGTAGNMDLTIRPCSHEKTLRLSDLVKSHQSAP